MGGEGPMEEQERQEPAGTPAVRPLRGLSPELTPEYSLDGGERAKVRPARTRPLINRLWPSRRPVLPRSARG